MNLNMVNVVVFAAGAILIYAAVKDVTPQAVVKSALGQPLQAPAKPSASPTSTPTATAPRSPVVSV